MDFYRDYCSFPRLGVCPYLGNAQDVCFVRTLVLIVLVRLPFMRDALLKSLLCIVEAVRDACFWGKGHKIIVVMDTSMKQKNVVFTRITFMEFP